MGMLTYQPVVKAPMAGRRMDMSGLRTSHASYLHRHMRDLKASGSGENRLPCHSSNWVRIAPPATQAISKRRSTAEAIVANFNL